ncbi:MAG TPA: hypothetical protein VG013_35365 [Gemmataceae bacterium]|jgi:hypothetical protein|nr:hypothetical protein [Gemmataceae bacterium]
MLAVFCLRLACGLTGSLVLLLPLHVNPRFYRTHFVTVLALTAGAAVLLRQTAGAWQWAAVLLALLLALLGSLAWSLEGKSTGWVLVVLTTASLTAALGLASAAGTPATEAERIPGPAWLLADDLMSAAVLGVAATAMLTGHSYLIAPTMSLTPLLRLLAALYVVLVLRLVLAAAGLWSWTSGHSLGNLEDDTVLWLPLRWGIGFVAPLVLAWMAREAAKIRSTQSATGILYVVVIFCFLGELTSQLLLRNTGFIL